MYASWRSLVSPISRADLHHIKIQPNRTVVLSGCSLRLATLLFGRRSERATSRSGSSAVLRSPPFPIQRLLPMRVDLNP